MHSKVDIGDYRSFRCCVSAGAGVGLGVGRHGVQPCPQVPRKGVPVLIERLRRSTGSAAGGLAHLLASLPRSLFVTLDHERVHDVVMRGPSIWLELYGGAKQFQRLAHRAARVLDRETPRVQKPRPLLRVCTRNCRRAKRQRLLVAAGIREIRGPARRLGLRVDVLGRLDGESREPRGRANEGLRRHAVAADRERKVSRLGLNQVAVDVDVMSEPLSKKTRNLADGYACLRHVELDVPRPSA